MMVDAPLRILHWNAQGLRPKIPLLQACIGREQTDVILLQETLLPPSSTFSLPGYIPYYLPHSPTSRGLLTLIKRNIPHSHITNPHHCGNGVEVQALAIHLSNLTLTCYNVYKQQDGELDLSRVFAQAETEPTLICGDFNAHHPILSSPSPTNQDGHHISYLLDEFPEVALLNNGEPTHERGGRLDLSFLTSTLRPSASWRVHPTLTSDHFGISLNMQLPQLPAPPPPPPRWNHEKANWVLFQNHLEEWHQAYQPPTDINQLEADLVSAFHEAADAAMPKSKPNRKNHKDSWYYNERVRELKHRLNVARRVHRKRPSANSLRILRDFARHVRVELKEIRTNKWLEWCAGLNQHTSLRELWHWLGRVAGKKAPKTATHPNPQAEAERLAHSFAERASSNQLPPNTRAALDQLSEARWETINQACLQPDDTDSPYTTAELHKVKHTGKDTSPGADRITYTMVNNMGPGGSTAFLHLLNTTHLEHTRPRSWNQQDTQPIPKPKDPGSHRPIALLSTIEKTAEKMVLNRLKHKVGPLHPQLYSYRERVGTQECITDVLSYIDNKQATVVFLDLEKAFELANPAAILSSLVNKGVKGHLLAWNKNYILNREARVRFQGITSSFKPFENGTPQGGILSPYLFNILIENLLQIQLPFGVEIFIFADDICIVARGPARVSRMQAALRLIQEECTRLGLKINTAKTCAMAIKSPTPAAQITLSNQPIQWVQQATYLGIVLDTKLSFQPEVQYLRDRAKTRLAPLQRMCTLDAGIGLHVLKTFYTATTRSLVDYAACTLTHLTSVQWASLEVLQNNAMRLMLGAPMWTRICNLQMETQIPPLQARIEVRNTITAAKAIMLPKESIFQKRLQAEINRHPELPTPNSYMGNLGNQIRATGLQSALTKLSPDAPPPDFLPSPPWHAPNIQFSMAKIPTNKASCTTATLHRCAQKSIEDLQPPNAQVFYTDGSVDPTNNKAAAAVYSAHNQISWRISDSASTLQTELMAIQQALSLSLQQGNGPVVIHTDSLSSVQALKNTKPKENINLLSSIKQLSQQLHSQERSLCINWIPSHTGIPGNDKADELAKAALSAPSVQLRVQPSLSQIKSLANKHLTKSISNHHSLWVGRGSDSANWHKAATNLTPPPIFPTTSRKLAVIIHRLRLGYKCNWQLEEPLDRPCDHCSNITTAPLLHYLLECPETQSLRSGFSPTNSQAPDAIQSATLLVRDIIENIETHSELLCSLPPPR